ncbi:MAG: PglZ domain-containing protein [Cytophagaceae bacterium]|jgi:CheY-like chemotaxis protein|nr:PglZ domain-containing protein [Cytophagaceae bacterium]
MEEKKIKLLWVDDEIEHLKAHIFFLREKGYDVDTATNGKDALMILEDTYYDLVFLDENMPGIGGLETLTRIKMRRPELPIIMITKNEAEEIMEQAIGGKIADYLIKPVNPNQILSSIKRTINRTSLVSKKTTTDYQAEFSKIGMQLSDSLTFSEWIEIYKSIVYWELELEGADSPMNEVLLMQKNDANNLFTKYIKRNYTGWMSSEENRPLMSHRLLKEKVLPLLKDDREVVMIVIDNFRYDQWSVIRKEISQLFTVANDDLYFSILPTATQFARNAIFSGLLPTEIIKFYPHLWIDDDDEEGSKNRNEEKLMETFFERMRVKCKTSYHKINDVDSGKRLLENYGKLRDDRFTAVVFNFVDILSHARTDSKMIRELLNDEAAYRSLTRSWFMNSPLYDLLKRLSQDKKTVIITTDHGTIRVQNPVKVVGLRETNTNLRYKQGKNLAYDAKHVFEAKRPELLFLPKPNVSTGYIFATSDHFFAYPNNYNYYVSYYKDTFQHGGISMEEMMIPIVVLEPKG